MKKIIYILLFTVFAHPAIAQDEENNGTARLREKMVEYIQERLGLSKVEAEKFQPIFLDYFKELRKTNQDFKGDNLVLQQKIIELRIKFRDQFKTVVGEKKSNDVFLHERDFVNKVREVRDERLENKGNSRSNNKRGIL